MHAFFDHGNITAPPILDEFNFLARGLQAGDEGAFAGPWPSDRAAWRRRHQKYRSHQHKAALAQQVLAKLETFKGNGDAKRILGYLRKIDPYVFEELVLLMLERQGIVVIRNESYSGDGGLDGVFVHQGCRYLLQAKRYKGAVSTAHVKDFGALITQHQAQGGLFIHTGKTPNDVYRTLGGGKQDHARQRAKTCRPDPGQAADIMERSQHLIVLKPIKKTPGPARRNRTGRR